MHMKEWPWGLPDPDAVDGSEAEQKQAFVDTLQSLTQHIAALVQLHSPDRHTMQQHLQAIHMDIQGKE